MQRRQFLKTSGTIAVGSVFLARCNSTKPTGTAVRNVGVQLYSVRKEMLADATGTLKKLAALGYKELESARSEKGNYYGLQPKEIRKIATDLGMIVRSGHVHIDKDWQQSIDQAAEAGQEYLVCSSMPSEGQTIANYERVAEAFSKAAEDCKKSKLTFGYHNHDYEFEKVNGKTLYDVLLEKSDPSLVKMEMDLGWVFVTGNDPLIYFEKYPGRFPLWHLKDMDPVKKHSVEFGKGKLNIEGILKNAGKSGMQYFFVEQEEYAVNAFQSLQEDYEYLKKLKV
jgi:sugar phosphate isomerase/epimerase